MSNPPNLPRWFTRAEERLAANEERIPTGSDIHLLEMAVNDYRALHASCELLRAALDAKPESTHWHNGYAAGMKFVLDAKGPRLEPRETVAYEHDFGHGTKLAYSNEAEGSFGTRELVYKTEADYIVQPGDTLTAIAERFGTTWQALARRNDLDDPDFIRAGENIRVPAVQVEPVPPSVEEKLRSALDRVTHNFRLLLGGKPVRDAAETLAECDSALSTPPQTPSEKQ